jgi:hypothetical protein
MIDTLCEATAFHPARATDDTEAGLAPFSSHGADDEALG